MERTLDTRCAGILYDCLQRRSRARAKDSGSSHLERQRLQDWATPLASLNVRLGHYSGSRVLRRPTR